MGEQANHRVEETAYIARAEDGVPSMLETASLWNRLLVVWPLLNRGDIAISWSSALDGASY